MLVRITVLALAVALCGCGGGAAPTPTVVQLALATAPGGNACPDALMPDVALQVESGAPAQLAAIAASGERIQLVFPAGTQGAFDMASGVIQLRLPGVARPVVVAPGQRVSFGGGAIGGEGDDRFFACSFVE